MPLVGPSDFRSWIVRKAGADMVPLLQQPRRDNVCQFEMGASRHAEFSWIGVARQTTGTLYGIRLGPQSRRRLVDPKAARRFGRSAINMIWRAAIALFADGTKEGSASIPNEENEPLASERFRACSSRLLKHVRPSRPRCRRGRI